MIAGEIHHNNDVNEIIINKNRKTIIVDIENTGDRTVQVGSHYHFYEVNNALQFDREITKGYRLNIPAGMSIRVLAGKKMQVELVEFAGSKTIIGFQGKYSPTEGKNND